MTFIDIIRESKTVVDSGFHAVELHSRYCFSEYLSNMELSSGFQLSAGFRIPWVESQIPKPRIPDFTSKTFPGSGFHRPKIPGFWNLSYFTLGEIIQDEITGSNASVTNNAESLNRQLKVIARQWAVYLIFKSWAQKVDSHRQLNAKQARYIRSAGH